MTVCPVCRKTFQDVDTHIDESHSDPDRKVEGLTEADYIRHALSDAAGRSGDVPDAEATASVAFDPLGELGVKLDDFEKVVISTETGGALTSIEAKRMFTAVESFVGFRYDRAAFIANLLDWGLRNAFTEELSKAGGFVVVSHPTIEHKEMFVKAEQLHAHISEEFSRSTGREFTFRRFGRFLGPAIPRIVAKNSTLNRFYTEGTPVSNRYGIAPQLFLCASSVFESIKPFKNWSREERLAWEAHNRAVVKEATGDGMGAIPMDLRPSPSQASTLVHRGKNDFGRRTGLDPDFGKGRNIFEEMASRPASAGKRGLGYSDSSEHI